MAWSACKLLEVMVLTLLLGLMLCSQVGSQFTQPGHKYKGKLFFDGRPLFARNTVAVEAGAFKIKQCPSSSPCVVPISADVGACMATIISRSSCGVAKRACQFFIRPANFSQHSHVFCCVSRSRSGIHLCCSESSFSFGVHCAFCVICFSLVLQQRTHRDLSCSLAQVWTHPAQLCSLLSFKSTCISQTAVERRVMRACTA